MTELVTAPKIVKKYRPWRHYGKGSADYYCVDADGTELLSLRPGKPPYRHIIGGVCQDCAFSQFYPKYPVSECTWPECPRRNGPSPRDYAPPVQDLLPASEETVEYLMSPAVVEVLPDPQPEIPAPEIPPVAAEVEQAARSIAWQVWSTGGLSRARLYEMGGACGCASPRIVEDFS